MYLWGRLDWISRSDIFVLAVVLAYVAFVFSRDSYSYRQACREPGSHPRALIVDLNRRVRVLQSIATAAPYLGLAGTCFGILESFRGIGMQKAAAMAMTVTYITASLLSTGSGLLVALAATGSSNYLVWLTDKLELSAEPCWRIPKYPLRKQFSKLPAFALLAAPSLAAVLAAFMSFSSFRGPVGLHVRLLKLGSLDASDGPPVRPLFIELSNVSADEKPEIYLNSKETTWDNLDSSVCNDVNTQPQPVAYVESDSDVPWAYVAMVIDSARAHCDHVVLLTTEPEVGSGHAP